jgi:hypothetical protein
METEVHDGKLDIFLDALEANKVLHWLPENDHVGGCWVIGLLVVIIIFLLNLATHEVEEGDLHTKHGLVSLFEVDAALFLDLEVGCHEKCLNRFALELILALSHLEVVIDGFKAWFDLSL